MPEPASVILLMFAAAGLSLATPGRIGSTINSLTRETGQKVTVFETRIHGAHSAN